MDTWSAIKAMALNYVGDSYCTVPYLYSNLSTFDGKDPNIHFWIDHDENNDITCVCLLYHTCLHVFSRKSDYNGRLFKEILRNEDIDIVMIPENNQNLIDEFPENTWHFITDFIFKHPNDSVDSTYKNLLLKNEVEIREVSKLLMSDPLYSDIYTYSQLYNQLKDRWDAGFGKIFIIKRDNKIVGCTAITGESDKFLFNGCVMVAQEYRRRGLMKQLIEAVKSYGNEKGKDCLYFVGVENSSSLSAHSKYEQPVKIGKIIKCVLRK